MLRNSIRYLMPTARQHFVGRSVSDGQPCRTFCRRHWANWYSPIVELESRMKEMDRHFNRMEQQINAAFGSPFFQRGGSFYPISNSRFFNQPTVESQVERTEDGKPGKYSLALDLGEHFSPDDIKISLKDRILTIEAKFESKTEGEASSRIYQEISRQFTLPEGINPKEVKSVVSPNGVLSIEVPLPELETPKPLEPLETPKRRNKEIPIAIQHKN